MTTPTLAWVTTKRARNSDEDEPLGLAALERLGIDVSVVDWDDTTVDWSVFDRVALRSTWDYTERKAEFIEWLTHVDARTTLANPLPALQWSMDKRYLQDLEAAGVPITPTEFVEPGHEPQFPPGRFIVKPAVGAGSRDASSYRPSHHAAAVEHVLRLHQRGQTVLIQPFIDSVATEGEWPLVFFYGEFSHAARKRVAVPEAGTVPGLFAEETNTTYTASAEQIQAAQKAIDVVTHRFGALAYARVDLVRADDNTSQVLEVELVEPSLFLPYAGPDAADRLAAALAGTG